MLGATTVRPVTHPPERQSRWATRPEVPFGIALFALSFSGSPAAVTATSVGELQKQQPIHLLNSFGFGLRAPGVGRRPSAQARRFYKPRYSLSAYNCSPPAVSATSSDELQSAAWGGGGLRDPKSRRSSAQSKPQLTAQISAPCSAQSTAQFSAPCPPHCGSAVAPPHFRRPLGFHLDFAHRKTSEIPLYAGGRQNFARIKFFRAPARFIYIRLTAEIVESLL